MLIRTAREGRSNAHPNAYFRYSMRSQCRTAFGDLNAIEIHRDGALISPTYAGGTRLTPLVARA